MVFAFIFLIQLALYKIKPALLSISMKKSVLTFFMFLLGSIGAIAQHYKTDSIIDTIKEKEDSLAYHQVLLEFHKLWSKGRYDTILSYEDKLFKLGKQIGYNKGIRNLCVYTGNSYNGKNQNDKVIRYKSLTNYQKTDCSRKYP